MSGQDAHDLEFMRRELRAAQRVDKSLVDADIRARRHQANVAGQWVKTRERKHREARRRGETFDEAAYLRQELDISIATMERWIIVLRNWDAYERRRREVGPTGYSGAQYARSLIREAEELGMNPQGSRSHSGNEPEPDRSGGNQKHHERLKNATQRATNFQSLYLDLAARMGETPRTDIIVPTATPIEPTVRLRFGDAYHGDCLSVMPTLPLEIVDLAIWDLPFGLTNALWDVPIDLGQLWAHTLRLLKPEGVVIAFGVQPFTSQLVIAQQELYRCQWHRLVAKPTNFLRTDIQPLRVIEDILVFSDSGEGFIYQPPREKLDTPYRAPMRRHASQIYRITSKMQTAFGYKKYEKATPISLLDLQFAPNEQIMPTQKPVLLLKFLIETYTRAGMTVFDPTSGMFSTAVACHQLERKFIGIEKDANNFHLGLERLRGSTD